MIFVLTFQKRHLIYLFLDLLAGVPWVLLHKHKYSSVLMFYQIDKQHSAPAEQVLWLAQAPDTKNKTKNYTQTLIKIISLKSILQDQPVSVSVKSILNQIV